MIYVYLYRFLKIVRYIRKNDISIIDIYGVYCTIKAFSHMCKMCNDESVAAFMPKETPSTVSLSCLLMTFCLAASFLHVTGRHAERTIVKSKFLELHLHLAVSGGHPSILQKLSSICYLAYINLVPYFCAQALRLCNIPIILKQTLRADWHNLSYLGDFISYTWIRSNISSMSLAA